MTKMEPSKAFTRFLKNESQKMAGYSFFERFLKKIRKENQTTPMIVCLARV